MVLSVGTFSLCVIILLSTFSNFSCANKNVVVYDSFSKSVGPYSIQDYNDKWSNPFGLGEMALNDTRSFSNGVFSVSAVPFKTAADFSVYDHLKYAAFSKESFDVPANGSVAFSVEINVVTPGTQPGRIIKGTYPKRAGNPPYAQPTFEGQQAAAVLNMIDFYTGQLFDIFVSGQSIFALVERLPSTVSGSPLNVTLNKIYTQIVKEMNVCPGTHKVEMKYTRLAHTSMVQYFLDGVEFARVNDVGIPVDVQKACYTGVYPSFGAGEKLVNQINSFTIGHGLFTLLDAWPFQYATAPNDFVSIPLQNRLFGQGASAKFSNFIVTTLSYPPTTAQPSPAPTVRVLKTKKNCICLL